MHLEEQRIFYAHLYALNKWIHKHLLEKGKHLPNNKSLHTLYLTAKRRTKYLKIGNE